MAYYLNMRWTNKLLSLLAASLLGSTVFGVPASELKENYQSIIERNPFGLHPPPPPPTNNTPAPPKVEKPKREIFLTGITAPFGRFPKQVFLEAKEPGPKKDPTFYAMREGVEQDGIKILSIDPAKRLVHATIDNNDTTLTFESHGITNATGMVGTNMHLGMPLQPGAAPHPGTPVPVPGAYNNYQTPQPIGSSAGTPANTYRQIPSRRIRAADSAGATPYPGVNPTPLGAPGQPTQPAPIDPAEQYLRMHLDAAAQQKQTGIEFPPLPIVE